MLAGDPSPDPSIPSANLYTGDLPTSGQSMPPPDALGLFVGPVVLGAIHGMEPGHGWPVAATYALDRTNHVLYGLLASLVIGVGHLVSSLAMVAAFFYAKSYLELEAVNEPITLFEAVRIGGPVSVVAGVL